MPTRDEVSRELAEELGAWLGPASGDWYFGSVVKEPVPRSVRDFLISLKLELIAARERIRELEKNNVNQD